MEISNSNNAAITAFQANVSGPNSAQQARPAVEQQAAQPSASVEVSISEEAQALFRSEQNSRTEIAQLQSGDKIGDRPK